MNQSIAFAKWVLNKHCHEFDSSLIGDSDWNEFIASIGAKTTVDNLIPVLLEPMPKKRINKKKDCSDTTTTIVTDVGDVAIVGEVVKPVPKKRVNKKKDGSDTTTAIVPDIGDADKLTATTIVEEVGEVVKPVPKKRVNKKKDGSDTTTAIVGDVGEVGEVVKPVPKKRVNKKKDCSDTTTAIVTDVASDDDNTTAIIIADEIIFSGESDGGGFSGIIHSPSKPTEEVSLENHSIPTLILRSGFVQKVTENNHTLENIIPTFEQFQLQNSPRHTELHEEETELTEVFIDDVLFYTDNANNWFDFHLTQIAKPL